MTFSLSRATPRLAVATATVLLALVGLNGIGRLGYRLPDQPATAGPPAISKGQLLKTRYSPEVFNELVAAYLSTGAGIAVHGAYNHRGGHERCLAEFDEFVFPMLFEGSRGMVATLKCGCESLA